MAKKVLVPRPLAELQRELEEQRAALKASRDGYDHNRHYWEAKRIATVLYTMFHDGTGRTISIATQLGFRDKLKLISTALPEVGPSAPHALVIVRVGVDAGDAEYIPMSAGFHEQNGMPPWSKEMSFEDWWSQPVFQATTGEHISREKLIFAIRTKDGGAHFDGELGDEAYAELRAFDGASALKRHISTGGHPPEEDELHSRLAGVQSVRNAHFATVRQMAFEVEYSLAMHFDGYVAVERRPPRNATH